MKLLIVILFLSSLTIAQIISGGSFVGVNKDINISTNTKTNNLRCNNNNLDCIGVYPCTTKTDNIDFSIQDEMVFACTCPCVAAVVSSPKPFFISKKGFYAMDLSKPLILSDTSLFLKVDSINNWQYATGCFLPFKGLNQSDSSIIIETYTNNYALIMTAPVIDSSKYISPYCQGQTYFGGYSIHWFLQQNGTTDFSSVKQTNIFLKFLLKDDRPFSVAFDRYTLSRKAFVSINIYNLTGRFIKSIINQMQEPGKYKIDLPKGLSSGAYILSLSAGGQKIDRLIMAGK